MASFSGFFYRCLSHTLFVTGVISTLLLPVEEKVWAGKFPHIKTNQEEALSLTHPDNSQTEDNRLLNLRRSPRRFFTSRLNHLPVLADGQAALPSNANNFHGGWNAAVDPRTGSASFSLAVGNMNFDLGRKHKKLVLSYVSGASALGPDSFGLGSHWSWNVGIERMSTSEIAGHKTADIITGSGYKFTMESNRTTSGSIVWRPLRHKLHDAIISGMPGDWTITMIKGMREHLKNGYEDWEETRDGQRIWFYYTHDGGRQNKRQLLYICSRPLSQLQLAGKSNACQNKGIKLTYNAGSVTVHGQKTFTIYTASSGGIKQVKNIVFPSLDSKGLKSGKAFGKMLFSYDNDNNFPWLLHSVTYPTGMTSTFLYNRESSRRDMKTNGLPVGFYGASLPVVTEQITHTGNAGIPDRHIWYRYGKSGKNQHNYIGYQGASILIPGKDNLMDRPDNYTYSVTVDNGLTSTTTTYNKYHLALQTIQRNDKTNSVIAEESNEYAPWKNTIFAELPPTYSLPGQKTSTIYNLYDNSTTFTRIVKSSLYNKSGLITWQRDPSGREVYIQYCPTGGDNHCPVMDPDWPQLASPEKVLVIPAHTQSNEYNATEVIFDYKRLRVYPEMRKKTSGYNFQNHRDFWQIRKKTTGTLVIKNPKMLIPGTSLPESLKVAVCTDYDYDTRPQSINYGQLEKMVITKPPSTGLPIKKLFSGQKNVKALTSDLTRQLVINVKYKIDHVMELRTITTEIDSPSSGVQKNRFDNIFDNSDNIQLGTIAFSLNSGLKVAGFDTMKNLKKQWFYDLWNRPVKEVITPKNGGNQKITTWKYIYGKYESAVIKTAFNGTQQKIVSGADGSVISVSHRFSGPGVHGSSNDTHWIPDTEISYTFTGIPSEKTVWIAGDAKDNKPGPDIALKTTYGYDNLNRPVWKKNPDGRIDITVRDDPAFRVIQYQIATQDSYGTGQPGSTISVTDSNISGKPVFSYVFSLDPLIKKNNMHGYSRPLQQQLEILLHTIKETNTLKTMGSEGVFTVSGKNGLFHFISNAIKAHAWLARTSMKYDGSGHITEKVMPNGATTRWVWRNGEITATITPDGRIIHDTHDMEGHVISRCVQPRGVSDCHFLGARGYNANGGILWQVDETGHTIQNVHDSDGRKTMTVFPSTKNDNVPHILKWTYNAIGPVEKDIDNKPLVKYTYDPVTWHLVDKEDQISHLHYVYDTRTDQLVSIEQGAPVTFAEYKGIHYPPGVIRITYDRYNRPATYKDRHGNLFFWIHDRLGRNIEERVRLFGSRAGIRLVALKYDGFGRVISIKNGANITRHLVYDNMGFLYETTDAKAGVILQKTVYAHDPETGNILSVLRQESNISAMRKYTYDRTGNLVSMKCNPTSGSEAFFSLCPRDTASDSRYENGKPLVITRQEYTFDHWNNIQTVTEWLADSTGKLITKTVRYIYSPKGKQQSVYDPHRMTGFYTTWSDRSLSLTPQTVSYDTLGRVVRDARGNKIDYNVFGKVSGFVNRQTNTSAHYLYDSDGNQVAKSLLDKNNKPLQPTLYMFYAGKKITSRAQADIAGRLHVSVELSGVAHSEDGKITRWYLSDYKGDVISVVNNQGQRVEDNIYSPYGMRFNRLKHSVASRVEITCKKPLWQSESPGFDGQMEDCFTGYQFPGGYRAYNPEYRRFMSKDSFSPFKITDGYGFANNNPVMNNDPSGHLPAWAGYTLAGLNLGLSIGLGILMPVAAAGVTSLTLTNIFIFAGVAGGVAGALSGSLQIAKIAHSSNHQLAITSGVFSLLGGIACIGLGVGTVFAGTQLAVAPLSLALRAGEMIEVAGVAAVISGLTGTTTSAMDIGVTTKPGLVKASGFASALEVLDILSGVSGAFALLAGLSAGLTTGLNKYRQFTSERGRSFFASVQRPGIGRSARVNINQLITPAHSLMPYERLRFLMGGVVFSDANTSITGEFPNIVVDFDLNDLQGIQFREYYASLNGKVVSIEELKEIFKVASQKVSGLSDTVGVSYQWFASIDEMTTRQVEERYGVGVTKLMKILMKFNDAEYWVSSTPMLSGIRT